MIKLWWHRVTTKRVDFGVFNYTEAEKLLAQGWELAKEEDGNYAFGLVYLEKRA